MGTLHEMDDGAGWMDGWMMMMMCGYETLFSLYSSSITNHGV
jgi:hypothetical protein